MNQLEKKILKSVNALQPADSINIQEVISHAGLENVDESFVLETTKDLIKEQYLAGNIFEADDEIYSILSLKLTPKGLRVLDR